MQFSVYHTCRSNEGWQPVEVASKSDPNKKYTVLVNPWRKASENICSCEGYNYRGVCRHQDEAQAMLCRWDSRTSNLYVVDPGVCPKCRGPIKTEIEVK